MASTSASGSTPPADRSSSSTPRSGWLRAAHDRCRCRCRSRRAPRTRAHWSSATSKTCCRRVERSGDASSSTWARSRTAPSTCWRRSGAIARARCSLRSIGTRPPACARSTPRPSATMRSSSCCSRQRAPALSARPSWTMTSVFPSPGRRKRPRCCSTRVAGAVLMGPRHRRTS